LPFTASLALAADFELPNGSFATSHDGAASGPKPRGAFGAPGRDGAANGTKPRGAFGTPVQLRSLVLRALVAGAPIAFVILLGKLGHFPTLSDDYWRVAPIGDAHGIGDYFRGSLPHSTLRSMTREKHLPEHGWIQEGLSLKNSWTPR